MKRGAEPAAPQQCPAPGARRGEGGGDAASTSRSLRSAPARGHSLGPGLPSQNPHGEIPSGIFLPVRAAGRRGGAERGAPPGPGGIGQSGGTFVTYVTYVTLCKERLLPAVSGERQQSLLPRAGMSHFQWEICTILAPGASRVMIIQCYYKTSGLICRNIPYAGVLRGDILIKIGVRGRLNR